MGNIAIIYDNKADNSTLSTGSWSASYQLDNLKDYRLKKTARTTNALAASSQFRAVLPANTYLEAVALCGTNLTTAATYRVRVYSDAGFTTLAYDSGVVNLYPAGSMPNSQIPAGSANSGTGKPLREEIQRWQNNAIHVLTAPLQARYILITIDDTTNPDGYVEIGRLILARCYRPRQNVEYNDVSLALSSRSNVEEARDGTLYFTRRRPKFAIPIALRHMDEDEAQRLLDLQTIVDITGEVLVHLDPDTVTYWWRKQVLGVLKNLNPLEFPAFALYDVALQVEGVL